MIEFETIVYLDLQKAATTSIATFLRHNVAEIEVVHGGHAAPKVGHDTGKFHFISVREPSALYRSLFLFGCSGSGGLFRAFKRANQAHLYEPGDASFHKWVAFMLDPASSKILGRKVNELELKDICGPLSQRLIRVSMIDPVKKLTEAKAETREAVSEIYHRERLFRHYVRVEAIAEDLHVAMTAPENHVRLRPPLGDLDDLRQRLPIRNKTKAAGQVSLESLPAELCTRIREREWLIYDVFGYSDTPEGAAPPLAPAG